MNIKQTLILLGGAALAATFGYLTASGHGVQPEEYIRLGIVAGLLAISTLGLMWAFRDQ
jgi:hypothetical protein